MVRMLISRQLQHD